MSFNFFGKIIGFIFGYLFLGPIGAVIGILIGNVFDKGLRFNLYEVPRERTLEVQQAFFKATFLVMGHLAKADGRVSENEIRAARKVMSRLELNEELTQEAIRLFNQGKEPQFNLDAVLLNLAQTCRGHSDLLYFFIEIQLEAALADGALQLEERNILLHICNRLKISPQQFEELSERQYASQAFYEWYRSQFEQNAYEDSYQQQQRRYGTGQSQHHYQPRRNEPSLHDAYGVLGVSPTADPAEIKKAYRRLMNQHHPDKLAARGLPEGMVKLAKEKTQQIRAAYDLIREARGFR